MFLATLFSKSQPYTNLFTAERELALFISKSNRFTSEYAGLRNQFHTAMLHEEYSTALSTWNHFVKLAFNGNSVYMATIVECEVDKRFT